MGKEHRSVCATLRGLRGAVPSDRSTPINAVAKANINTMCEKSEMNQRIKEHIGV